MKLSIYNSLGKQVSVLERGVQPAGLYNLTWDAKNLPAGVYLIRLDTPGLKFTKKAFLVK